MFEVPDAPDVIGVVVDAESVRLGLKGGWAGSWGKDQTATPNGLIGGARLIFERADDDEISGSGGGGAKEEDAEEDEDFPRAATF
jgi:hypothetical protein